MGDLTRSFSNFEFECRGKCGFHCRTARMAPEFLAKLQMLRDRIGKPIKVTSGIRCKSHNAKIGGAPKSWHIPRDGVCYASDIRTCRSDEEVLRLYAAADSLWFHGIGLYKGRIHVDMRPTTRARWVDKSWSWS